MNEYRTYRCFGVTVPVLFSSKSWKHGPCPSHRRVFRMATPKWQRCIAFPPIFLFLAQLIECNFSFCSHSVCFFFVVGQQSEDYSKRRASAPVYDIPRLFRKVHFSHVAQFHIFRIFRLLAYCDFALELGRARWCPSSQQHGLNVSVKTDRSVHFPYSSATCWNLWPRLQLNTEFISRRYEPMMVLSTEQLEAWVLFTEWHVTEKNPSNGTGGS